MEVRIDGTLLDIAEQEITIQAKNFRFAGAIADQYTQDLSLPKTANNMRLLDVCSLLDRTAQPLGKSVKCSVSIGSEAEDGYIQVVSVEREKITATLYLSLLPFGLLDRKITDILKDGDQQTSMPWNENTQMQTTEGAWGLYAYNYNTAFGYKPRLAQRHPVMRVNEIMQRLSSATGITLPTDYPNVWIMASKKNIDPNNHQQCCIVVNKTVAQPAMVCGGQHITNDLAWNCTNYGTASAEFDEDATKIRFNRACKVSVKIFHSWSNPNTYMSFFLNGEQAARVQLAGGTQVYGPGDPNRYASASFDVGGVTDLTMSFSYLPSSVNCVTCIFTITDYEVTEDDYGNEMKYVPYDVQVVGAMPTTAQHWTIKDGMFAWCWLGYFTNIPELTIRHLLDGMMWVSGRKIRKVGKVLSQVDADESKVIDCDIEQVSPIGEEFGQITTIGYADAPVASFAAEFANDFLAEEKKLHTSPFAYVANHYDRARTMALVPQYKFAKEVDEDSGEVTWEVDFEDLDGVFLLEMQAATAARGKMLKAPRALKTFGIEGIGHIAKISASTYDDVRSLDYIYYQGRKFMIVSADYNVGSGVCDFEAYEVTKAVPDTSPKITYTGVFNHPLGYANIQLRRDNIPVPPNITTETYYVGSDMGRYEGQEIFYDGMANPFYFAAHGITEAGEYSINFKFTIENREYSIDVPVKINVW